MTASEHAREASVARCDLNALYSVIAILEGGVLSAEHHQDASRIIAICKSGSGRALRRYDRHMAAIKKAQP